VTSENARVPGDFGQGPLGRFTGAVYWFLLVTVMLVVAALPSVVVMLLLDRSASNVPVFVLALVPLGPALSAGLYATRARSRDESLAPVAAFWRGYRLNWADVLRLWVPGLLVLGIIAFVLANAGTAGLGWVYMAVLAGLSVVVGVWTLHALAIASFFSFRTRDAARLALFYLGKLPAVSLGVVSLLIIAFGVTWFLSEGVMALLGAVWVWLWYRNDLRLLDDVERRFTAS
jgi:hypothetical protein